MDQPAPPIPDLARLAVHTMTHQPWSLAQCIAAYQPLGVSALSVWRNTIDPNLGGVTPNDAGAMLRDAGFTVPALVRGGFFPAFEEPDRQQALDDNRRAIDEAATINAEMVVLVVGAVPDMPLDEARMHVADGIADLLDHAEARNIKLAIEPLHPMYAADRSCINRMAEAREICQQLDHPLVGIALDVYHLWWDPDLEFEIRRAGQMGTLFAYHICDWRPLTRDLLNDRGLMGDGCIDLKSIRAAVEATGFTGHHEVEIFSDEYWAMDQAQYAPKIIAAYLQYA